MFASDPSAFGAYMTVLAFTAVIWLPFLFLGVVGLTFGVVYGLTFWIQSAVRKYPTIPAPQGRQEVLVAELVEEE